VAASTAFEHKTRVGTAANGEMDGHLPIPDHIRSLRVPKGEILEISQYNMEIQARF